MIRNIIKAALFFAIVISTGSITQVAMALDLSLENYLTADPYYTFGWTPDSVHQPSFYDINTMQAPGKRASRSIAAQRRFSLEVYQGDGLDDLRRNRHNYRNIILPKEDQDAYGISIKQWF